MSYLRAFGHHLPLHTVTNADLETRTGRTAASIEKTSGIHERRYATQSETVADLGLAAANAGRKNANLTANALGPPPLPPTNLGPPAPPAIDIPVASAGSLIALAFAADLTPRYGNILVVAAEIMSRRISDADPDTPILFGDGAGACLVAPDPASNEKGLLRIADTALFTDGNYADALQLQ